MLLSYAFIVQTAGWDAVTLSDNRVADLRNAWARAGIDTAAIHFQTDAPAHPADAARLEMIRVAIERDFGMLVVNMRGHRYKKLAWRDRFQDTGGEE